MLIERPVLRHEVMFNHPDLWCDNQIWWKRKPHILCLAHLAEGRVFSCGFSGQDDPKLVHCSDYQVDKPHKAGGTATVEEAAIA